MWQITWMLSFIPEWLWILLLVAGAVSYLISRFFASYALPMKIAGVLLVVLSLWSLGAASNEEKWQARITELEQKLKVAEEESKKINSDVVEKVVTKTKVIQGKTKTIVEYVDKEVVKDKEVIKYIEQCPVPTAIIDAHNSAATLNKSAEGAAK